MKYIFDLDGTIVDSSKRHTVLLGRLLSEAGMDCDISDYFAYKREGGNTFSYLQAKLSLNEHTARAISARWVEKIEDFDLICACDTLYDDALPVLKALKEKNPIYFLTCRANADNVKKEIGLLGLDGSYDGIAVCDPKNAVNAKADYLFEHFSQPNEVMLVGDTEADYAAALRFGCAAYLLNRGFRSDAFWRRRAVFAHDGLLALL